MARTQTLQEMVSNLRAEAGHSLAVAQGLNTEATLKYLIRRTQEELWAAFIWPELTIRDDIQMQPGVYEYEYSLNLKFDAIREAYTTPAGSGGIGAVTPSWIPVAYGMQENWLRPNSQFGATDSDPVRAWEANGSGFRVYPTPVSIHWLRFKGNRELNPLVANADRCTLDATCILLFAAAEMLARSKAEDAANKLQKGQRHLQKLLGNQVSAKNKISTYGTLSPHSVNDRIGHTVIVEYP